MGHIFGRVAIKSNTRRSTCHLKLDQTHFAIHSALCIPSHFNVACMKQPSNSSLNPLGASPRDFTHLLESNNIPHDSDIPFIHDIISSGEERLIALDGQIDNMGTTLARLDTSDTRLHSLQAALAQLTQTRDGFAENIHQYRAVLHPVRRVPQELLCQIFVLTLSEWPNEDATDGLWAFWRLGAICRSWRHTALSYPPLWCSVTSPSPRSNELFVMMETQLVRARNAPLDILWRGDQIVESRFLELLVAHCNHWRTLRLNSREPLLKGSQSALNWLRPAAGRLNQLENLEMVTPDAALLVPDVFATAPALREVVLTDQDFTVYSPKINIPWTQITHYRGKDRIGRQLEIFKRARTLVECSISIDTVDTSFPDQDVVVLPHLRRLRINGTRILNHLEAPVLETLSSLYTPMLKAFIVPFVERCGCPLTKLVLLHCRISTGLIALLQNLPALTYLLLGSHFDLPQTQTSLFDALTLDGTPSDLCPNLTSFSYGYPPTGDETDSLFPRDAFFAMAQSRFDVDLDPSLTAPHTAQRPSRLTFLRIFHMAESPFPPSDDVLAQLEALRTWGLDAEFLNYGDFESLKARGDFF